MKTLRMTAGLLLCGVIVGEDLPGQETRHYKVVALQGEPAGSAGRNAVYGIFGVDPRIGPNGHVVFGGFVNNNGAANYAIWTGLPGEIRALAVQGDEVPGRSEETLDVFFGSSGAPYWICDDGSVGFQARLSPSNDVGYWLGMPGALEEVAITNNPVPGVPGATFKAIPPGLGFLANGESEVMLKGTMQGGGTTPENDTAVWAGTPGELEILAREGDQAPGLPSAVRFSDLNFTHLSSQMSLNSRREYCLSAGIETGSPGNNRALFVGSRSGFTKVLQKGDRIPGHESLWASFDKPRLNNVGTVFFEDSPLGGARSFFTREASGAVYLAAREQENPPGDRTATWDQFFFSKPALGGNNQVAFNAGLAPGANFDKDGTWVSSGAVTRLVARVGDDAPGFPGQSFTEFQWINFHRAPAVNSRGTVIFRAKTSGGADAMWRWRDGESALLLAVGDFLDLGGGDVRRVADFSVKLGSGGQSGEPSAFNDCGQLVFRAAFNSGGLGTAVILIEDVGDCDGDGVDGLLEEAFGGDPHDPSDGAGVLPRVRKDGAELVLVFLRRTDDSFTYGVERSGSLRTWQPSGLVPVIAADQSGVPDGAERVEVAIPLAGSADHLRVRVTRAAR